MLKDVSRNRAYKEAIFDSEFSIKDKIVLDVGAGTGILSIFCAQVGAAKVYAVALDVIKENGFENVIEVQNSYIIFIFNNVTNCCCSLLFRSLMIRWRISSYQILVKWT